MNHQKNIGKLFGVWVAREADYIHQNPVTDGIVEKASDYFYSSARNYADMESALEVVVLPPRLITY